MPLYRSWAVTLHASTILIRFKQGDPKYSGDCLPEIQSMGGGCFIQSPSLFINYKTHQAWGMWKLISYVL